MVAPLFLGVEQLLDIVMGELPEGIYATDRADDPDPNKRSYTSSELRAHSQMFANLYSNVSDIYADKFVTTMTDGGVPKWEKDLFGSVQTGSITDRKAAVIVKFRAGKGISVPAITALVASVLGPLGVPFQILPYSGQSNGTITGAWVLGASPLGLSTWLSFMDPLLGARQDLTPLDCSLDYAAAGLTLEQLQEIQFTAYAYELQIFGTVDAATLSQINALLTTNEPARSDHVVANNAPYVAQDPDIIDFGAPGSDTIMDIIDFGSGAPAATFDVWDFNSN